MSKQSTIKLKELKEKPKKKPIRYIPVKEHKMIKVIVLLPKEILKELIKYSDSPLF